MIITGLKSACINGYQVFDMKNGLQNNGFYGKTVIHIPSAKDRFCAILKPSKKTCCGQRETVCKVL